MKKLLCVIAIVCGFCVAGVAETISISDLRKAMTSEDALSKVKGVQLIYSVSNGDKQEGKLYIRMSPDGKIRVDFSSADYFSSGFDGKKGWGCDEKNGVYALEKKDLSELFFDIAFLPVNYGKVADFSFKQTEDKEHNGVKFSCYEGSINEIATVGLWVKKENGLLRRIEFNSEEGQTISEFLDYRAYNNVKFATLIRIAAGDELLNLRLENVWLNVNFKDEIFARPADVKAGRGLLPGPGGMPTKIVTQKRKQVVQKGEIERITLKIRELEIKIEADSNKLAKMEELYVANQKDSVNLLNNAPNEVHYHHYHSWYGRYGRVRLRKSRYTRNAIKQMCRDNKAIAREYKQLYDSVTKMRLQKEDLSARLELLQAQGEEE